jgi:hypothetical protein
MSAPARSQAFCLALRVAQRAFIISDRRFRPAALMPLGARFAIAFGGFDALFCLAQRALCAAAILARAAADILRLGRAPAPGPRLPPPWLTPSSASIARVRRSRSSFNSFRMELIFAIPSRIVNARTLVSKRIQTGSGRTDCLVKSHGLNAN